MKQAATNNGLKLRGAKVVIQGFGNVGFCATLAAQEIGCTIIGISDSIGGIYCPDGLNPQDLLTHREKTQSIQNYPNCKNVTNEELLELNCDTLIPAALENQITAKNADSIHTRMVVEAANGPTTPDADNIFY